MALPFSSVEIAVRVDGKANVWALLPDPAIDRKRPDFFLFPKLWQVVDIITRENAKEKIAELERNKVHVSILPSKYR